MAIQLIKLDTGIKTIIIEDMISHKRADEIVEIHEKFNSFPERIKFYKNDTYGNDKYIEKESA